MIELFYSIINPNLRHLITPSVISVLALFSAPDVLRAGEPSGPIGSSFFIQRGCADAETYTALGGGGLVGRTTGSFQSIQPDGAPGYWFGWTTDFNDCTEQNLLADIRFYAVTGQKVADYIAAGKEFITGYHYAPEIPAFYYRGGGAIVTYGPESIKSGNYIGNLDKTRISFIRQQSLPWGVTVLPREDLTWPEGDQSLSVLGPGHPVYQRQRQAHTSAKSSWQVNPYPQWVAEPSAAIPGRSVASALPQSQDLTKPAIRLPSPSISFNPRMILGGSAAGIAGAYIQYRQDQQWLQEAIRGDSIAQRYIEARQWENDVLRGNNQEYEGWSWWKKILISGGINCMNSVP
jgi:hypothetical protein